MVEKIEVLEHHSHFLTYLVYVCLRVEYVLVIDENLAACRLVKALSVGICWI